MRAMLILLFAMVAASLIAGKVALEDLPHGFEMADVKEEPWHTQGACPGGELKSALWQYDLVISILNASDLPNLPGGTFPWFSSDNADAYATFKVTFHDGTVMEGKTPLEKNAKNPSWEYTCRMQAPSYPSGSAAIEINVVDQNDDARDHANVGKVFTSTNEAFGTNEITEDVLKTLSLKLQCEVGLDCTGTSTLTFAVMWKFDSEARSRQLQSGPFIASYVLGSLFIISCVCGIVYRAGRSKDPRSKKARDLNVELGTMQQRPHAQSFTVVDPYGSQDNFPVRGVHYENERAQYDFGLPRPVHGGGTQAPSSSSSAKNDFGLPPGINERNLDEAQMGTQWSQQNEAPQLGGTMLQKTGRIRSASQATQDNDVPQEAPNIMRSGRVRSASQTVQDDTSAGRKRSPPPVSREIEAEAPKAKAKAKSRSVRTARIATNEAHEATSAAAPPPPAKPAPAQPAPAQQRRSTARGDDDSDLEVFEFDDEELGKSMVRPGK